jgi:hypothetical protein
MKLTFGQAQTQDEIQAAQRVRYSVYVQELDRYHYAADDEHQRFAEVEDQTAWIFYARDGDTIVGTGRLSWGGYGFSERQIEQYQLDYFFDELPPDVIAVGERYAVLPEYRGMNLLGGLSTVMRSPLEGNGVKILVGASEPHLLPMYMALGQRPYTTKNINSPEAGYLIPIMSCFPDAAALKGVGHRTHPNRVPECVARLFSGSSWIRGEAVSEPTEFWGDIHQTLEDLHGEQISAFDNFTDDEAQRCISHSTIIPCAAGDRVVKRGGAARNIFVVLEGLLVALDEGRIIGALSPGDVFGEMEFLLENKRSFDVDAATDDTRVLCLSEGTLRKMISEDAPVAAKLLANVSKMLCVRLIQAHARWASR